MSMSPPSETSADQAENEASPPHLAADNLLLRRYVHPILITGLGFGGFFLCYKLLAPFLTPVTVALVLAVLFGPLHHRLSAHLKAPRLAALLSVTAIAAIVLAVLTLLIAQIVREAAVGADLVRAALADGLVDKLLASHPTVAPALQAVLDRVNVPGLAADGATWLTNASASFLRGSVVQIAGGLLTFFLLFYFLRDKREILAAVRSFLPFTDRESDRIFTRAVDTIHATVYGVIVIGLLTGLFGGVVFAAVGLPAPLFWGVVMAAFAILPVVGTGMIWVPAAIFLALDGDWGRALIIVTAFGMLTAADIIAYPYVVSNRMGLHTVIVFFAAIGGLIMFGAVGFILGPVIVAVTAAVKDVIWARLSPQATAS